MNTPALSHEAQQELDRIERDEVNLDDFPKSYVAILERLASRVIPDIADLKINDLPFAEWEAKRQEIRIAQELKLYATALLPADISAAVAKLPPLASLDDFLDRLMPNTGREVRLDRFNRFLAHEAEMDVDEQTKLHPRSLTRKESVDQMVLVRLANLEHTGLCAEVQHMFIEEFRSWWRRQDKGHLSGANATKKRDKTKGMDAMLALLPCSKRPNEGLTKRQWKDQAELKLDIPDRTFDRYFQELGDRFEGRETGRFRRKGQASKNK